MRALILMSKTGEGHNSCAQALQEVFRREQVFCAKQEVLSLIGGVSESVPRLHTRVYRSAPVLFRAWYRVNELPSFSVSGFPGVRSRLRRGARRLRALVRENGCDTLICTHIISALLVTEMQRTDPLPVRTCFVATDYTCSPGTWESALDFYFIPDAALAAEFTVHGIPAAKLVPTGIPVRQAFYTRTDPAAAKAAFGVQPEHRHLVVMGGSMGCGPLAELARLLARGLAPDEEVTLVCGTNRRLYRQLSEQFGRRADVHIAPYVRNVSQLLDSADLYLTKPGGLCTSEAAAKALPMVLLNVVAGCESHNLDYFVRLGGAAGAGTPEDTAALCLALLRDDARRLEMAAALAALPCQHAAQSICGHLRAAAGETESAAVPHVHS